MISVYLRIMRKQHSYLAQLKQVNRLYKDWEVSKEIKDDTHRYYTMLWNKRGGYTTIPKMFNSLPLTLRMEVNMDIFWEAFRHSHIFTNEDPAFKRALALKMKSEMCMPGDYIFKINEPKNKLVYIVAGTVQVLYLFTFFNIQIVCCLEVAVIVRMANYFHSIFYFSRIKRNNLGNAQLLLIF